MVRITTSAIELSKKKKTAIQKNALLCINREFMRKHRALVTMACGSGKSRLTFMTIESQGKAISVVAVPNLGLVRQVSDGCASWKPLRKHRQLIVCSEMRHNDVRETPEEYGLNVTTDPEVILEALNEASEKSPLIVIITYQSFKKLEAAVGMSSKKVKIGLLVADEAHNTAGDNAKQMGRCLLDDAVKIDKRLFLTATPRTIGKRTENAQSMNCMNDPVMYGRNVFNLSFSEAIKQGITCDYEIRIMEVNATAEETKALNGKSALRSESRIDALAQFISQEMRKKPGMRIFSFHTKCPDAQAFNDALIRCGVWSRCITGEMKVEDRKAVLREFESKGESRIITSVRVFAEGVDVPSVDTVMLTDPITTPNQIAQMVGRGQRMEVGKDKLTVFLPIFHPVGESLDVAEQLAKCSYFKSAVKVLRTMQDLDERLESELRGGLNGSASRKKTGGQSIATFDFTGSFAQVVSSILLKNVAPFEPKTVEELVAAFRVASSERPHSVDSRESLCGRTINAWGTWIASRKFGVTLSDVFDLAWPDSVGFVADTVDELVAAFREECKIRPRSVKGNEMLCGRTFRYWYLWLRRKGWNLTLGDVFDLAWPESISFNPKDVAEMIVAFRKARETRPSNVKSKELLCGRSCNAWRDWLKKKRFTNTLPEIFDMAWPIGGEWCPILIDDAVSQIRKHHKTPPSFCENLCGYPADHWEKIAKSLGTTVQDLMRQAFA